MTLIDPHNADDHERSPTSRSNNGAHRSPTPGDELLTDPPLHYTRPTSLALRRTVLIALTCVLCLTLADIAVVAIAMRSVPTTLMGIAVGLAGTLGWIARGLFRP